MVEEADYVHLILAVEVAAEEGKLRFLVVQVVAEEVVMHLILAVEAEESKLRFLEEVLVAVAEVL